MEKLPADAVKLDDGRVVRYVSPDWDESDPRWDEPTDLISTDFWLELVDGEWVPPSKPISFVEHERKTSPFPEDYNFWD